MKIFLFLLLTTSLMLSCKKDTDNTQNSIYNHKWNYVKTVTSRASTHTYQTSYDFLPSSYVTFNTNSELKVVECNTNCATSSETFNLTQINDYYKINTSYRFWQYLNDTHIIYLLIIDENNIVVAHGMNSLPDVSGYYSGNDEVFWFYYQKG